LIIILLTNFPQALSRYLLGIIYIGIILIIFKEKITGRKFDYLLLGIFLLAFPILQLFKYYTVDQIFSDFSVVSKRLSSTYNSADFDAYSIFSRSFVYVDDFGFKKGKQLSSTVLFFIPRSIWKTKPYFSGKIIAEASGQEFTNLACPLMAEGYIDFGIIGMVIYYFVISYVINYFDYIYWKRKKVGMINIFYPFLFGCLIFILRGALQPTYIYCFSFLLFYFAFIKRFVRNKGGNYFE
jgi:hypothetical protein